MLENIFNQEILISQGILSLNFGLIKLFSKNISLNGLIFYKSILKIILNFKFKKNIKNETIPLSTFKKSSFFEVKFILVYFSTVFLFLSLNSLKFSTVVTLTAFNPLIIIINNYLKKKNSDRNTILLGLIGGGSFLLIYFDSKVGGFYIILHLLITYFGSVSQMKLIKNKNYLNSQNNITYFYNIFFSFIFGILFDGLRINFNIILLCILSLSLNYILEFYNQITLPQKNPKNLYYNTILIILINMFLNNIFFSELNNIFDIIGTGLIMSFYYYDDVIKKIKIK